MMMVLDFQEQKVFYALEKNQLWGEARTRDSIFLEHHCDVFSLKTALLLIPSV